MSRDFPGRTRSQAGQEEDPGGLDADSIAKRAKKRRRKRRLKATVAVAIALAAGAFLACAGDRDESTDNVEPEAPAEPPAPASERASAAADDTAADDDAAADDAAADDAGLALPDDAAIEDAEPSTAIVPSKRRRRRPRVDRDQHRRGMPVPDNLLE